MVNEEVDHEDIGLPGFYFNLFDQEREGYVEDDMK